ncbi:putative fasciclin-like arabinogalactan protein 20 [Gastrolobium bilobum]|uniref:putative fasciclin-like arabinogalactan protein 20 n=1 Tax=Gastrolobium bilobum TaxID=150636 RepID=UPI002AAF8E74|nr:putative fasciclin-like arabinogalactan protein 20 [Gastrolobium bilobum]
MEETPTILLLLTLTITLLLFPTTISTEPLFSAAAQTLTDSGFLSMGLTLRLASPTLRLPSPATTATIFIPSDAAFLRSGSLPLSLLQYHILPARLPLQHLTTLPPSTPLPTLLPDSSLTVTASSLSPPQLSINNVTVSNTAVFDDGSLLMLAVDDFFNSSSLLLLLPESAVPLNTEPLAAVSDVLRSNGCSIMATFLETQVAEFNDGTKLTVFAPVDVAVAENVRNIGNYSAIFRKHVVPRLIPWLDLTSLRDETLLPTFSDGFVIRVTVSPSVCELNGVPVKFPDMYRGDLLVVHGVDGLLDNSTV